MAQHTKVIFLDVDGVRQVLTDIFEGLTYTNYEACVNKLGSPVAT
jgi:hypothetical protein